MTQSSLFAEADSSLSAASTVTIEQTAENKWRMVQEVEGAPASVSEVIDTWNQVTLQLINRPGPRRIRAHIVSNVSGACQGMDASLAGETFDKQLDEGNNGCANDWTLTTNSYPGASAAAVSTLDIGVFILGGQGLGFGPGKGTVTTEIELLDEPPQ